MAFLLLREEMVLARVLMTLDHIGYYWGGTFPGRAWFQMTGRLYVLGAMMRLLNDFLGNSLGRQSKGRALRLAVLWKKRKSAAVSLLEYSQVNTMNWNDLLFYVLDAIVMATLFKMRRDSKRIEVATKLGPRWVIPCIFWGIAAIGLFNYSGVFRVIQTALLVIMGVLYWGLNSGLSPDGIVMIGKLYPYQKLKSIKVDDEGHRVEFSKGAAPAYIDFNEDQMKEVHRYLSKNAGLPVKSVRRK